MVGFSLLLKLLKEGRIPPLPLLEKAIKNFPALDLKEQTSLIVYGRNHPQIRELLERLLPLDEGIKTALLEGSVLEITFPTVDKTLRKAKLSKVYLIENSPQIWTNAEEYRNILETKIYPLTGKKFVVLFEEKYEGYSFLLPLAIGLLAPRLLAKCCFSGNLTAEGKLIPVEGLEEKHQLCLKEGKILVTSNDFEHLKELLEYVQKASLVVPILISATNKREEVLAKNFELLRKAIGFIPKKGFFKRLLNTLPYEEIGPLNGAKDWNKALVLFEEFINRLDSTVDDAELHLSLIGPAPLAFAYGIMHGPHKKAVFYHFQGNNYFPTVVINEGTSREVKRYTAKPLRVEAEFIPNQGGNGNKTLSVILDMVSHPIKGSVLKFLRNEGINTDILVIYHKNRGMLEPNRLWTEDIAETFTLIRKYFAENPYEEINFFFGTPVAFAFGLGVAFGHYAKGRIYSFYKDRDPQYAEVLRLEDIRKVR